METSVYVDLYFNEESVFTLNICATRIWPLSCSLHESKGLNTQQRRGNRKGYSLNILSNLLSLSLLSLGPSVQTEQQQPLQFLTGSLRRFQLYSLWKRLDIQIPSVYFVGRACSLILICSTSQPWCPTSVIASSILCFKNHKAALLVFFLYICVQVLSFSMSDCFSRQTARVNRPPLESLNHSTQSFFNLFSL